MRSTCKSKLSLALTGLLPGVLLLLLSAPVFAHTSRGPIPRYDAAHEVTIGGTVQQVITKRTIGSPVGLHLLVNGAQGPVDVHVGPYLTKNIQKAVRVGLPVQVVGSLVTVRGKQIVLVRQLIYAGQTVAVRNNNGFLLKPAQSSLVPAGKKVRTTVANGGAR